MVGWLGWLLLWFSSSSHHPLLTIVGRMNEYHVLCLYVRMDTIKLVYWEPPRGLTSKPVSVSRSHPIPSQHKDTLEEGYFRMWSLICWRELGRRWTGTDRPRSEYEMSAQFTPSCRVYLCKPWWNRWANQVRRKSTHQKETQLAIIVVIGSVLKWIQVGIK